jgi:hypothetical protein
MDTVTGVKLNGEMTLQDICETWEEAQEYDEN